METYPLGADASIHHFDTGPFNWYVIREGGRLTLVDAGFPGHYRVFADGIAKLGHRVTDVAAIVLTHAHADHMGFAERVRRESGAPVYVHKDDRAAAQQARVLPWYGLLSNAWRPYTLGMLAHATVNGVFWQPPISRNEAIADGQVLDIPGRPHVLHVPGHTPGEIALYLAAGRIMISGDALVTRHLLNGAHGAPQVVVPILTGDTEHAHRSLDRMRLPGAITLLPGHGKAWHGDIGQAIEQARSARRERELAE